MATQLEKLQALAKKHEEERKEIEKTVFMDDFLKAFKEVMAFVERAKAELKTQSNEHKEQIEKQMDLAVSSLNELKTKVETRYNELLNDLKSDQRTFQRLVDEKIKELFDEIPDEYNDEELQDKLNKLQTAFDELKIPDAFDATELENQVDKNTKDIEDLKNRPVASGGGVTNARITQAFKTILKTEAPSGDIDGVNTTYTVTQPIFAVLAFSLNGEVIPQLPNYTISGNTIEFSTALPAVYSGKDFEVKYI